MPLTYMPFLLAWIAASITIAFGQVGMIVSLAILGAVLFLSLVDGEAFLVMLAMAVPTAGMMVLGVSAPIILTILAVLAFIWYAVFGDAYRRGTAIEQTAQVTAEGTATFFVGTIPLTIALFEPGFDSAIQFVMFGLTVTGLILGSISIAFLDRSERTRKARA